MKLKKTAHQEILDLLNLYLIPTVIDLLKDMGLDDVKVADPSTKMSLVIYKKGSVRYYNITLGWKTYNILNCKNLFEEKNSEDLLKLSKIIGSEIEKMRKKKAYLLDELKEFKKSGIFIEVYERQILLEKNDNNKR